MDDFFLHFRVNRTAGVLDILWGKSLTLAEYVLVRWNVDGTMQFLNYIGSALTGSYITPAITMIKAAKLNTIGNFAVAIVLFSIDLNFKHLNIISFNKFF